MIVSLIVAVSENQVIGKNNDLIWRLPADMAYFKSTTLGHHVLTGRKNYESIPEKYRPLPERTNLVVSRTQKTAEEGSFLFSSINQAIEFAEQRGEDELFVIGGGEIYLQTMPLADRIYLTRVHQGFEGDTYFPILSDENWKLESSTFRPKDERNIYDLSFQVYAKK